MRDRRGKAPEDRRTPRSWRDFAPAVSKAAVLDCGSPLPLFSRADVTLKVLHPIQPLTLWQSEDGRGARRWRQTHHFQVERVVTGPELAFVVLNSSAPFAPCRGIIFDLDDTLYDRHETVVRLFEHWWGPLAPEAWREIDRRDARGHSPRVEFFSFLKDHYPVPEDTGEALWARYQREFPEHIRVEDTLPVLRRLAQTELHQAILTNGSSAFQRAKYHAAGLEAFIGVKRLFISGEIGREKPDPTAFHHACSALELAPQDLLFVGDHPEKDIAGARAAGLLTCWIQKAEDERADADATIRSLDELLPLLGLAKRI